MVWRRLPVVPIAIFAVAAAARLWITVSAGVDGNFTYDPSVYYAAGDALSHGLAPYHGDFVLLHPPMIALVGVPFALLGRLTNDQLGFFAENVASAVVGAVNAVLVFAVAQRWGLPRRAAIVGALFYACWVVSVGAESLARLEPLGNLFLLLGMLALGAGRGGGTRPLVAAGVCFGLLANVKLWWAAAILVLLGASALAGRSRSVALLPLGVAVGVGALLDLPFLVIARGRMVRSIITAQLSRPGLQWSPPWHFRHVSPWNRLLSLTGSDQVAGVPVGHIGSGIGLQLAVGAVCVAFVASAVAACRSAVGRVFAVLFAVQILTVLFAPIYYSFYGGFVAVGGALTLAAAVANGRRAGYWLPAAWAPLAIVTVVVALAGDGLDLVTPIKGRAALATQVAHIRCITSDSPVALIALNALDRSFESPCRDWVDFQGVGHGAGPDAAAHLDGGVPSSAYVRDVVRYLRSGDAMVVTSSGTYHVIGPTAAHILQRGQVIARGGSYTVRAVSGPALLSR